MRLTLKQEFYLRRLGEKPMSSREIALMARAAGLNKTSLIYEWSDAPLRQLRDMDLADRLRAYSRAYPAEHFLTDKGRNLLMEIMT